MNRCVLEKDIVCNCDKDKLMKCLHVTPDDEVIFSRMLEILAENANKIHGGFAVAEFPLQEFRADGIVINDLFFQSTVLAKKLHSTAEVLVFVATCGRYIGDKAQTETDYLDKYIYDQMAYLSLLDVLNVMQQTVRDEFGYQEFVRLSPGSVVDWSVGDVCLFSGLIGPQLQELNLRIMKSGLIDPLKSSSGFIYSTSENFITCSICSRANCPTRQAAFVPSLHATLTKESHAL